MLTLVAITQRVVRDAATGERRDALDQCWSFFLGAAGIRPLILPNHAAAALSLADALDPAGVILSGGGDLCAYGGDAPERDETEAALLRWAAGHDRPVLGVCRGMQHMLHRAGVPLQRAQGHVRTRHRLALHGRAVTVNSYHDLAAPDVAASEFEVLARAEDGTIEAVRHRRRAQLGIMWHPEREAPFAEHDLAMFTAHFVPAAARAACAG